MTVREDAEVPANLAVSCRGGGGGVFPKLRVPFKGVPVRRVLIFEGLYCSPRI